MGLVLRTHQGGKGDYFMIVFTIESTGSKSSSPEDLEEVDSETSKDGLSEPGKRANNTYRQTNIFQVVCFSHFAKNAFASN